MSKACFNFNPLLGFVYESVEITITYIGHRYKTSIICIFFFISWINKKCILNASYAPIIRYLPILPVITSDFGCGVDTFEQF